MKSLSEELRDAIGESMKDGEDVECVDKVDAVFAKIIVELRNHVTDSKLPRMAECTLVQTLYSKSAMKESPSASDVKRYESATVACAIQFLEWCRETMKKGKLKKHLLRDFYYDFSNTRILGDRFNVGECWRAHSPRSIVQYRSIESVLNDGVVTDGISKALMSIFGLRQLLEAKFRRILGLLWIDPMPKLRHNVVPDIVKAHEKDMHFSRGKKIALPDLMHIYDWTDVSIHSMSVGPIWMVWKALYACEFLFRNEPGEKRTASSLFGTIEFEEGVLLLMRDEFRRKLLSESVVRGQNSSCVLIWDTPEARVVKGGKEVRVNSCQERLSLKGSVTSMKPPGFFILTDRWPTGRAGCLLSQLLKRLGESGIKIVVCSLSNTGQNVGTIGVLTSKWYLLTQSRSYKAITNELRPIMQEYSCSTLLTMSKSTVLLKAASAMAKESPYVTVHKFETGDSLWYDDCKISDSDVVGVAKKWFDVLVSEAWRDPCLTTDFVL